MTLEEAFERYLPKWPVCIIYGDSITQEQALEIIRRTDSFFTYQCGNNHEFIKNAIDILCIPQCEDFCKADGSKDWDSYEKALKEWKEKWQYIPLEYLSNDWISCSWIGGPNGWCQPTGRIASRHSIGKWPKVKEVYEELCTIAEAFPFLSLTCVISDKEDGEEDGHTVVSFKIKEGKVELVDNIPLEEAIVACKEPDSASRFNPWSLFDCSRENYFSLDQLREWRKQAF